MSSWRVGVGAHVRAFEFYQGLPKLVVPDNTKTGVTKSCRYDPDLNLTYQEMAVDYGAGVVPTRPYKPRDKAYVSSCTSFRRCDGESRLLGPTASVALRIAPCSSGSYKQRRALS